MKNILLDNAGEIREEDSVSEDTVRERKANLNLLKGCLQVVDQEEEEKLEGEQDGPGEIVSEHNYD